MLPQHVLTVLEDWRSMFEDDELIAIRDLSRERRRNWRHVRNIFDEITGQLGLPALQIGSCRMVFAVDKGRVLKVGFSRWGMMANQFEAQASRKLPRAVRAEVYAVADDGLWLVQERVEPGADLRTREARALREALEEASGFYVDDFHRSNVGRRADGSLVMLDLEFFFSPLPREEDHVKRYLNY